MHVNSSWRARLDDVASEPPMSGTVEMVLDEMAPDSPVSLLALHFFAARYDRLAILTLIDP